MSTSAFVSVGAIISLVGAMTTPSASGGTSESPDDDSAPALVLPLTTALGEPTEVATSALASSVVGGGGSAVRPTSGTSLSLLGADGDVLDPADDAAILTEPLEVDPFFITGLTWDGASDLPDGTDVYIRVREGENWSEWYLTDPEASQRDDGVGRAGTEPFVTGGADGIQVRVTGTAEDLPENLALTMLPSNPDGEQVLDDSDVTEVAATATAVNAGSLEGADDTTLSRLSPSTPADTSKSPDGDDAESGNSGVTTQSGGVRAPGTGTGTGNSVASSALGSVFPASTTATDLPVSVSSRADWGADESAMTWDPTYAPASFVVVHHTAGTNNYTMDQSASVVRGIYQYHAVQLGWGDIGYNFLVDKWGRAFEGRAGSLASPSGKMVVGAHDLGFNTGTMGISMIGDYSTVTPSSATLDTVGKLAGWQLARAGVSATGTGSFTPSISNGTLVAGRTVTVNRISGHRDTYATACPGDAGYAQLGKIRGIAATVDIPVTTS
ncbi:peptidoglycan recognition protein family protein, partial [Actinomyces polynesiensis]|uniref:peptidoglycan recognition protein family protein n=1 Tax=Actinomyces polynesiensis TaxID=1325934 RepID=UPI0005B9086B